jgi:anthranilate synthase component 1
MVEKAKEYIRAGDIFQVVPSQRLSVGFNARPVDVYRALRALNPSPYMYFVDLGGTQIVGSSPEILARLKDGKVVVRPLAGTRKRGATEEEDRALEAELLADPKERAEHVMLIDLGRNDIGRISETGTVEVSESFVIERYSHVMHIVSQVQGTARPGLSYMDVLKATFPAGTLSGAPKIRALEIIQELEPYKRNIYAGAIGWIGWWGDADTAIAIRTAVIQDGRLHVQAGAGIVYDSDPAAEWEETMNKGRALFRAVAQAAKGL